MNKSPILTRLVREANKTAQLFDCDIKAKGPWIEIKYKSCGGDDAEFDVRIEDIKDPLGRQLMSVGVAGHEERFRAYATADGSILFGMLYAWE